MIEQDRPILFSRQWAVYDRKGFDAGDTQLDSPDQALHCPTCAYNLSGLPENRCPECGNSFDPDAIRKKLRENAIKPITLGEVVFSLIALPGIFLICQGLVVVTAGAMIPFTLIVAVGWLFGGMVVARTIAKRLAVTNGKLDEQGNVIQSPWFVPCCTIGLYLVQIAIGAGPRTLISIKGSGIW